MHPIVIVMQQAEALPAHLTAHTCAAPHLMSWGKHIVLCICHSSLRHVLYTPAAMGGMGGMGGGMPGGMGGGMPGGMGGGMPGGGGGRGQHGKRGQQQQQQVRLTYIPAAFLSS